jgi:hypothetical protein
VDGEEADGFCGQGSSGLSEAEVVYLDPEDTFAVIRERLRATEGDRVVLVVPKECPGLDSLVDLKLLARQVAALEKEVTLVSTRREFRELARSLGFRTFSSTAWARRTKWPARKKGLPLTSGTSLTRKSLTRSMLVPPASGTVGVGGIVVLAAAFAGMLAFMALLTVVFVPTAKVTLHPVVYPVSSTMTVVASPDLEAVDFINVRIPARQVELEVVGDDEIATTALRDEPDAKAIGEVVFTNKRSEATTVMSDTVVVTSGGTTVRFVTTDEVIVPAGVGSRGRAPVEAVEPGPTGNVPAYSINRVEGPMDRQVNVINVAPTTGGGMSQVAYVTAADKDQLSESSLHKLKEEGYYTLTAGLAEGEILPHESLLPVVLSETYDKFPGEVADSLGLHMQALVRGTVINKEDVDLLGLRMLELEVREGFQLLLDQTEVRIDEISDVDYDGTLTFQMTAEGLSWMEIDAVEVQEAVRGKSAAAAEEYLEQHYSLATEPVVEISPSWWDRIPWLPFRIAVEVVSQGQPVD